MRQFQGFRVLVMPALAGLFVVCAGQLSAAESYDGDQARPNFILMIGDDMAVETLDCYGAGADTAHTPTLNDLCGQGVRFDNFWAQPVCSPTRATLLTGQYGFENGVGSPASSLEGVDWKIPGSANPQTQASGRQNQGGQGQQAAAVIPRPGLKPDAYTFLHALSSAGYQTAAVGKWHLADENNGGLRHPGLVGFDYYAGSMRGGGVSTYDAWSKVINGGEPFGMTSYPTSDMIDDGLAWLETRADDKPFFLWVAFNAPHTPFHMPPKELLSSEARNLDPNGVGENPQAYYNAMIEAMDTEIGRLLANLDEEARENTYVIFMGDNGTPGQVVQAPFVRGKAKGSVYQGGINVPFMVTGPGIKTGQVSASLANSVDLFDTVLEISGVTPEKNTALHSVDLTPVLFEDPNRIVRDFAYVDQFGNAGRRQVDARAIRNTQFKLIQDRLSDTEELYDLSVDPYEDNNLLAGDLDEIAKQAYDELAAALIELTGEAN